MERLLDVSGVSTLTDLQIYYTTIQKYVDSKFFFF